MDRANVMESIYDDIRSAAMFGEVDDLKNLVVELDDGRELAKTVLGSNNHKGVAIIHYLAVEGKLDVLNYLIEELGIDVDTRDEKVSVGDMNTVQYLLANGADPKISTTKGYTPLHCAAVKGHTEILTRLLSRGVDINAFSKMGTPLEVAAGQGQLESIQILLGHNANPNVFSSLFTPLTASIIFGEPQSLRCVEVLLEAGADPDCGSHALLPLVAAATEGLTEIVKRLIQAGANPDVTNSLGLTPLEFAALNGDHNMAEILFPVTSRIPGYVDWSLDGVIRHVHSDQAEEQRKLKAKEKFGEAKFNGADAFKKQNYFQAMFFYTEANQIDPCDAAVLSNRSMCWAHLKEGENALEDACACIQLRPNWSKAYYRAGVAYNLLNRYGEAQRAFLQGLKLSPNSQELKDALRKVEAQMNTP